MKSKLFACVAFTTLLTVVPVYAFAAGTNSMSAGARTGAAPSLSVEEYFCEYNYPEEQGDAEDCESAYNDKDKQKMFCDGMEKQIQGFCYSVTMDCSAVGGLSYSFKCN